MKKLLPVLMVLGVFLGSAGESFAEPGNRYLTSNQLQYLFRGSNARVEGDCPSFGQPNIASHKMIFRNDQNFEINIACHRQDKAPEFVKKAIGRWSVRNGQICITEASRTYFFITSDRCFFVYRDRFRFVFENSKGKKIWDVNVNNPRLPKTVAEQYASLPLAQKKSPEPSNKFQKENLRLRKEIARLKKDKEQQPKRVAKKTPQPTPETATSGSGFFVSKTGHVITNQHIVNKCKKVTVGDNAQKQVATDVIETDRENDLALLKISSLKMASVETKSLIQKLGIKIIPLASDGLLRSEDVDLGEDVLVAGYPYGEIFSDSIKVTKGIVSANKGLGDDSGQFQMDAAVQPGSSGGPVYDANGNIVGVVVANLNKLKFAKQEGSLPELVNFGIKASTVRQFLSSSGLPTKWSKRSKSMSTRELAKIAKRQTLMVMCHR